MPKSVLPKVEEKFRFLATFLVVAIELGLSFSLGLGLVAVGLGGAAWILSGIVAGAVVFGRYRTWVTYPIQPNRTARKLGQMIIGLSIGLSLQSNHVATLATTLPIFLGLPVLLLLAGGAIGVLYSRLEKIDVLTALLATTPGNIGVMATIAADYSKNAALVSLVQLLRFTTVIFLMSLVFHLSVAQAPNSALAELWQQLRVIAPADVGYSSLMLAIVALTASLGNQLKIPLAAFLSAIGMGLLYDGLPLMFPASAPVEFHLPLGLIIVGQTLLGLTIGEYWGLNPRIAPLTIVRALVPVGLTLLMALAAAGLIHRLTAWSWLTCLLFTAPGGSPEMIWLALTLNQDTEIVTAGHLVRLLAINLALPLLVSLSSYFNPRESTPTANDLDKI